MAGYTRFLVGNINTRLAMLPLDLVVNRRNIVAIRDRMWTRLLFSTGQPPFDAVVTSDDECDAEGLYRSETATGGCTVSFGDEYESFVRKRVSWRPCFRLGEPRARAVELSERETPC